MPQSFTHNDLVRLLYNEVSPAERGEIEQLLQRDPALREEYKMLQEGVQKLDEEPMLNPSAASMNAIHQYSRETIGVHHTNLKSLAVFVFFAWKVHDKKGTLCPYYRLFRRA